MKKFPCLGCEDRAIGCHGTCQKYAEANAENERVRNERAKVMAEEAYHAKTIIKNRHTSIRRKMGK